MGNHFAYKVYAFFSPLTSLLYLLQVGDQIQASVNHYHNFRIQRNNDNLIRWSFNLKVTQFWGKCCPGDDFFRDTSLNQTLNQTMNIPFQIHNLSKLHFRQDNKSKGYFTCLCL